MKDAKPGSVDALTPEAVPEHPSTEPSEDFQEDQPRNDTPVQPYLETPQTSDAPSESDSTQPTTPSSAVTPAPPRQQPAQTVKTPDQANFVKIPIVPAVPNLPLASRPSKRASVSAASEAKRNEQPSNSSVDHITNALETADQFNMEDSPITSDATATSTSSPAKAAPKSWADLVKTMVQPTTTSATRAPENTNAQANGFASSKTGSLADALSSFSTQGGGERSRISFLKPRGLVNTGNMCYMNSVSRRRLIYCPVYCVAADRHFRFFKS